MLAKTNRLRKTKDIQAVLAKGRAVRESGLLLKKGLSEGNTARFGIIVSKKVAKRAVRRNRIRRLLSEAIREELKNVKKGTATALIVLPGFEITSQEDIQKRVHTLFQKASLLK